MTDVVKLAQKLIQFNTVTPKDDGILDYLSGFLVKTGFKSDIKFFGENEAKTGNIYAKFGSSGRNFCFAGHVDVVPVGNESKWRFSPFEGAIEDGILYGRGAVDMKGEIAAFIIACNRFLVDNPNFSEQISIFLTGDEEDTGEHGLKEMIKYICDERGEKIDACVIGEPTCENEMCDSIKVGRRGSVNFEVEFIGLQGHVAYQDLVKNPITTLGNAIVLFKNHKFDNGNEFFEPTNLEFVNVETDNSMRATNVVPSSAKAMFNIRYNNIQTGEKLVDFVKNTLEMVCGKDGFKLRYKISNDSFLFGETEIANIAKNAILKNTNLKSVSLDCRGGTTDGRHIIKYCKNTVEVGLNAYMAHKIDECVSIEDLKSLESIYYEILNLYFNA